VEKLFSLQGNYDKPDSVTLAKNRADLQGPCRGFDASKIRNINRILATKRVARKKIFTQGKNCFVAQAACSKVAKPEFASTRRDAVLRSPVQLRHGTGPARAANGKHGSSVGMRAGSMPVTSGSAPG
jgi:hypothetical protein